MEADQYEVIVVDNGSTPPFDPQELEKLEGNFRLIRIDAASRSPVQAVNRGLAEARGQLIGILIDGARIVSPGLLALAVMAERLSERAIVLSLAFHLGSRVQMESVLQGYDQEQEDLLLAQSGWSKDGYRLFDISVFAGSSTGGWFQPITESNAIFMRRPLWEELGGYDERFQTPGGGLANLDTLSRAVQLDNVTVVTLLGEATFHQVHGGAATNAIHSLQKVFHSEYEAIRGRAFRPPAYRSLYLGTVPANALESVSCSAQRALDIHSPK